MCDNLGRIKIRCRADLTYTVVTYDGKEYLMKYRQSLQTNVQDPDLAMVTFESRENYEIAPLGNSDNVSIQSDVLVAGFPTIFGRVGKQRTFTITNGKVVTFIPNSDRGYGLVYNATTFIGNSGGPVFDIYGRVIGIHGLADTDDGETNNNDQSETVNGVKPTQKTGFNAGIPINIFFSLSNFNRQLNPAVSINRQPNSTNPNNVSLNNRAIAYHDRGVNRHQSGDRQGAIEDFNRALNLGSLDLRENLKFWEKGGLTLTIKLRNYLNLKMLSFEVVSKKNSGEIVKSDASAIYFVEDLGDDITLEMVEIPGGTFTINSAENRGNSEESAEHLVTVPSFFMGKYEITQEQYQAVTGDNPSYFKGDKRPVERVKWNQAVDFCEKLSQITGRIYTLPSEAQWEYACRAGTSTARCLSRKPLDPHRWPQPHCNNGHWP